MLLFIQGILIPPRVRPAVGADNDLARTRAFLPRQGFILVPGIPVGLVVSVGGVLGVNAAGVGGMIGRVVGDVGVDGLGLLPGEETVFCMRGEVLSLLRWRTRRS